MKNTEKEAGKRTQLVESKKWRNADNVILCATVIANVSRSSVNVNTLPLTLHFSWVLFHEAEPPKNLVSLRFNAEN